jgi:tripartite-type tricarboxylate transporter receptor subunit TctC
MNRPTTSGMRIVASAAAGTAMDVHGRLHGQWLSERLAQPFIVENRPGRTRERCAPDAAVRFHVI